MTLGICDCLNKNHKANLIKALEKQVDQLNRDYMGLYQGRKEFNKAFERGTVSTTAENVLSVINQSKLNFESTLIEIKSIPECKQK